jgi:hypothetical protein
VLLFQSFSCCDLSESRGFLMKKDKATRKLASKSAAVARSGREKRREKGGARSGSGGRYSGAEERLFAERMAALGLMIREVPGKLKQ